MRHPFGQPSTRRLLFAVWVALATMQLLASPAVALAQAASSAGISGRVIDSRSGDPIPSATVQIEGTRLGGITGLDGRYRIANIPAGARSLVARRLGFSSVRRAITVVGGQDQTIDISLQVSAVALDQIVVTGTA